MARLPSIEELMAEVKELRRRFEEAEETIRAIRSGEVDAFVVSQLQGEQVYTLHTADRPYRLLVERMHQGAVTVSKEGIVLYCNRAFAELLDKPVEAIIGAQIQSFITPPSCPALDALLQGTSFQAEIMLEEGASRSTPIPTYITANPLTGDPTIMCLIVTDLTAQKRHEEVLASEILSRSILEQAVDGIVVADSSGRVVRANPAAYQFCGHDPTGELFEMAFPLIYTQTEEAKGSQQRVTTAPILQGQRLRSTEVRLEARANRGTRQYQLLLSAGPLRSTQQQIIGFVATLTDITERKQYEAEREALLREAEQGRTILEAIMEYIPEGLAIAEAPDSAICRISKHGQELIGRPAEVLTSTRVSQHAELWGVLHAGSATPAASAELPLTRAIRHGEQVTDEEWLIARPDGSQLPVSCNAAPIHDRQGNVIGGIVAWRDITERRQVEEALRESDRRKDEFLAMLAHELRNPLAAISNAIQLLPPDQLQETQSWAREVIERQIKQLSRLIDDLLDISRISRGKFELKKEIVEFQSVLNRTVETIQPLLDEKQHTFKVSSSQSPLRLHADPARLEQMLGNLLINAAKYTDPGGRIELSVEAEAGELVIRVTDTGIGLSQEMLGRIFEMFTQGPNSAGRSHGGLGLGLAFVRTLAKMHGGSISAESGGPGQGSAFILRLPALSLPETASASSGKIALSQNSPIGPGSKRILVVDDNIDTAQSLARLLTNLGYDVRTAYDGFSALTTARTYRPDIMLLDLGLPGMDGYQVARELRQDGCFREASLRLIAISGYGQAQDRNRSTAAGFDHHFLKPVKFEQLLSLLNDA